MTLEERIMQDLKVAMKAKDQVALRSIRAIKSAILLAKTDGSGKAIDKDREIQMLQKLVKQRKESIEIYEKEGRDDLAKTEHEEVAIIEKYLPEQLSEAELEAELKKIIDQVGAESPKDIGKVMGVATKQFAGTADGKMISQVAKKLLSEN